MTTITTERLRQIASGNAFTCTQDDESASMAAELLAVREAQPVASTTKSNIDAVLSGVSTVIWPVRCFKGEIRVDLYTAPPAPAVPSELLDAMAEVIRISDRDHEAWDRAKAAILACRAAKPVVPIEMTGALAMTKYGIKRSNYIQWVKGWNAHGAAMLQPASQGCKWTYDEHDYKWDSACGEAWQFTDGGPEDNGVKFCQGCGKPAMLAAAPTPTK